MLGCRQKVHIMFKVGETASGEELAHVSRPKQATSCSAHFHSGRCVAMVLYYIYIYTQHWPAWSSTDPVLDMLWTTSHFQQPKSRVRLPYFGGVVKHHSDTSPTVTQWRWHQMKKETQITSNPRLRWLLVSVGLMPVLAPDFMANGKLGRVDKTDSEWARETPLWSPALISHFCEGFIFGHRGRQEMRSLCLLRQGWRATAQSNCDWTLWSTMWGLLRKHQGPTLQWYLLYLFSLMGKWLMLVPNCSPPTRTDRIFLCRAADFRTKNTCGTRMHV